MEGQRKRKPGHVGAPACFELELAARAVAEAFDAYGAGAGGLYLVGSALERPDWRDVDVRLILHDAAFDALFPGAAARWEQDARWLLLTAAVSQWMSARTGLPIDFQFQRQTEANKRHPGPRAPLGLRLA